MDDMNHGGVCRCPHHKIVPVAIILIGITFLLGTFNVLTVMAVSVIWPVLLIVVGFAKLNKCKCCAK